LERNVKKIQEASSKPFVFRLPPRKKGAPPTQYFAQWQNDRRGRASNATRNDEPLEGVALKTTL